MLFLTKKISQFLFLAVEDILVLYPPIQDKEKITHFSPEKNLLIALHHGSNFILINKTTILLHKYFKINLCILFY